MFTIVAVVEDVIFLDTSDSVLEIKIKEKCFILFKFHNSILKHFHEQVKLSNLSSSG